MPGSVCAVEPRGLPEGWSGAKRSRRQRLAGQGEASMRRTLYVGVLASMVAAGAIDAHAQAGRYPRVAPRRELHAQLLLPARPELHAVGAELGAGRGVDRGGDERVDLAGGPRQRGGRGADLQPRRLPLVAPDWSPDGRWIVYTADHDGDRVQLELLEVATGETRALTDDGHVYADPTFSPDGTRIAYVSTRPQRLLQRRGCGPVEDGRWAGDEMPNHERPRLSRQPALLRPLGHAPDAGVAAREPRQHRERRAAAGLEPRHPPRLGQRPPRARRPPAASSTR